MGFRGVIMRIAALAALALAACATPVAPPNLPLPADFRLDRTVEPLAYTLAFPIDPTKDRFSGVAAIDLKINQDVAAPAGLTVVSNALEQAAVAMPNGLVRRDFAATEPLPTYLLAAFESFTLQNHAPLVNGAVSCPASGPARIALTQSTSSPLGSKLPERAWTIPICINAYPKAGSAQRTCAVMATQTFDMALPVAAGCPSVVTLNAGGAGYFRTGYEASGWAGLSAHLARLAAQEQASVLSDAEAAFAAGAIEPAALLALIEAGARSADPHVLRFAIAAGRELEPRLPPQAMQAYQAWLRRTFDFAAKRLKANGGDDGATRLALERMTRLLAEQARSQAVRACPATSGPWRRPRRRSISASPCALRRARSSRARWRPAARARFADR
jgi:aminopeptidase N